MSRRERSCPRCNGNVSILLCIKCSSMLTVVAKCDQCGRSWGIGIENIKKYNIPFKKDLLVYYKKKWNNGRYGESV